MFLFMFACGHSWMHLTRWRNIENNGHFLFTLLFRQMFEDYFGSIYVNVNVEIILRLNSFKKLKEKSHSTGEIFPQLLNQFALLSI